MLRPYAEAVLRPWIPPVRGQHITEYALVVTSPGFQPTTPVLAAAAAAGVPIWGDVELAWRLDASGRYGPPRRWLVVTGTNGKTTTTSMLHAMLTAAGRRSLLCGNIGEPGARRPGRAGRACWPSSCPASSCTGRPRCGPRPASCSTSPRITWTGMARWTRTPRQGPGAGRAGWRWSGWTTPGGRAAGTAPAPVRVGFRLGEPGRGRAGCPRRRAGRPRLRRRPGAAAGRIDPGAGPVGVLDALAAAALARCGRVAPQAIGAALSSFRVGRHRPRWWLSSTASPTSTIPRPPTRTPPRRRCWHTRGWCGSPAVCSRVRRSTRWSPEWLGWSERC